MLYIVYIVFSKYLYSRLLVTESGRKSFNMLGATAVSTFWQNGQGHTGENLKSFTIIGKVLRYFQQIFQKKKEIKVRSYVRLKCPRKFVSANVNKACDGMAV
jgi:hypothetical protein